MNIEQLREEAAENSATGNALYVCHKAAFIEGAEWEYNRPKWFDPNDDPIMDKDYYKFVRSIDVLVNLDNGVITTGFKSISSGKWYLKNNHSVSSIEKWAYIPNF